MQDHSAIPAKCAHCQADLRFPMVCSDCRALHVPPEGVDFFRLFGLSPGYAIDPVELNRRFLDITRCIHPDRFASAGEETRMAATRLSALVNQAMSTLSDPVLRSEYLLELHGGKSAAVDRTVSQEVLTQVLMFREELAEARETSDSVALQGLMREVTALESSALAELEVLARRLPTSVEAERRRLREVLNSLKYYQKLRQELE